MAGYSRSIRDPLTLSAGIPPTEAISVGVAGDYMIWFRDDHADGQIYLDTRIHEMKVKRIQAVGGGDITEGDVVALY